MHLATGRSWDWPRRARQPRERVIKARSLAAEFTSRSLCGAERAQQDPENLVRILTVRWVHLQNTGPARLAQRTGCCEEGGPAHACSLGL